MRYMFGDYTLDAERYTLHRGETPVRLEPRVFNLLAYLVQHPGRTVTKEELRAQLWPDQPFMSDDPLTNCVAQARKALGDSGQGQRYIKTMHGRGYCFIAPVDIQQPAMTEVRRLTTPDIRIAAEPRGLDQADTGWPSLTAPPATPLPAQDTACTARAVAQDRPAAERRQLTVLVCRLVGLSASAAPLDLEVLLEVVRDYQESCAAVVHRFDGYIARVQSDRLLVYFGYPQAHEDDARRAVHTGLGLVARMAKLTRHLKYDRDVRLAVRVGIHTGVMVIGVMGSGDQHQQLTLGDTPTIAARLHSLAEPDTVVISPATWRLVAGYFVCEALGAHVLDDLSEPLTVYRVLQKSTAQHRLDVAIARGMTLFVGREHEVGLLRERWQQATDGMGQVVLLSGEAGIGKSRLVQVLKEHLAGEPHTRIECCCSPYYQHSALYPVIEHLQRLLKLRREDTPQEQLRKLEDALQSYDFPLEEVVPLFAALLSLPPPASYPALPLTPQHQKQKTFDALLAWVLKEAEQQPVCFIVEDLHWADPSTSEFLDRLIDHTPAARLLLVLLFRPDYRPPWPVRPRLTQIALGRLSHRQVECMVGCMVGDTSLPAEVLQQLVAKTDGVPLFVEELTKMVLESGLVKEREGRYELVEPLPSLAIPDTLHDSLMARLDCLGSAKQVAQLGATIGREFSYELIQAVAPVGEETLHRELGRLVEAELLYQRGLLPQARYLFKHALIQEMAYQSLLKSTRRQYHQQIAEVLEARFPQTVETHPELLAYHAVQAEEWGRAVRYLRAAGDRTLAYGAYTSAAAHYEALIDAVERQGPTGDRTAQLDAYLELWVCRIETGQFRGLRQLASTIESLALTLKDSARLAKLRLAQAQGLYYFPKQSTALHQAIRTAQEAVALTDPTDLRTRSYGRFLAGVAQFDLGQFSEAVREFNGAEAVLQAGETVGPEHALLLPIHVSVCAFRAEALAMLGEFDRAVESATAGCQLAERLGGHPIRAQAQALLGRVLLARGDVTTAVPVLEAGLAIAHAQRATLFTIHNAYLLAWATALLGDRTRSAALLATATQLETSLRHEIPRFTRYGADRARLLLAHDRITEAATQAESGLALATVHGARRYEPELWHLQAQIRLRSDPPDPEGALHAARRALTQAITLDITPLVARCHLVIGQLLARSGDRASAQQHLTCASGLFERLGMTPWQTETAAKSPCWTTSACD